MRTGSSIKLIIHVSFMLCGLMQLYCIPLSYAQNLTPRPEPGYITSAALSPDKHAIALNISLSTQAPEGTWFNSELLEVQDAVTRKALFSQQLLTAKESSTKPLAAKAGYIEYCDGGKSLVAYDKLGAVHTFDTAEQSPKAVIRLDDGLTPTAQLEMHCAPKSPLLVVAYLGAIRSETPIRLFDLRSGVLRSTTQIVSANSQIQALRISPSGERIGALIRGPKSVFERLNEPNLIIIDSRTGAIRQKLSISPTADLAFISDDQIASIPLEKAASERKRGIYVWEIETGKKIRTLTDSEVDIGSRIAVAADQAEVAADLPTIRSCIFCNGLEGREEVIQRRIGAWNSISGRESFRSSPLSPAIPHVSPEFRISNDASVLLLFWPHQQISVKLVPLR